MDLKKLLSFSEKTLCNKLDGKIRFHKKYLSRYREFKHTFDLLNAILICDKISNHLYNNKLNKGLCISSFNILFHNYDYSDKENIEIEVNISFDNTKSCTFIIIIGLLCDLIFRKYICNNLVFKYDIGLDSNFIMNIKNNIIYKNIVDDKEFDLSYLLQVYQVKDLIKNANHNFFNYFLDDKLQIYPYSYLIDTAISSNDYERSEDAFMHEYKTYGLKRIYDMLGKIKNEEYIHALVLSNPFLLHSRFLTNSKYIEKYLSENLLEKYIVTAQVNKDKELLDKIKAGFDFEICMKIQDYIDNQFESDCEKISKCTCEYLSIFPHNFVFVTDKELDEIQEDTWINC